VKREAKGVRNAIKESLLALCVMLFAPCLSVDAQQPPKLHRIGYLSPLDPVNDALRSDSIRKALRAAGYIEGQSIVIEYQYAHGQPDRLPGLAAELVRRKVNIIIVSGGDRPIRRRRMRPRRFPLL
jgi:putative tryptophan/tyrosine transport system substrate-binding protein